MFKSLEEFHCLLREEHGSCDMVNEWRRRHVLEVDHVPRNHIAQDRSHSTLSPLARLYFQASHVSRPNKWSSTELRQ